MTVQPSYNNNTRSVMTTTILPSLSALTAATTPSTSSSTRNLDYHLSPHRTYRPNHHPLPPERGSSKRMLTITAGNEEDRQDNRPINEEEFENDNHDETSILTNRRNEGIWSPFPTKEKLSYTSLSFRQGAGSSTKMEGIDDTTTSKPPNPVESLSKSLDASSLLLEGGGTGTGQDDNGVKKSKSTISKSNRSGSKSTTVTTTSSSSSNTQKQRKGRKNGRKMVRFSKNIDYYTIENLKFLSSKIKSKLWLTGHDVESMEQESRAIVSMYERNVPFPDRVNQTIRGLEKLVTQVAIEYYTLRAETITAVLEEQEHYRNDLRKSINDYAHQIAKAYQQTSLVSKYRAIEVAKQDHQDVYNYYVNDPTCTTAGIQQLHYREEQDRKSNRNVKRSKSSLLSSFFSNKSSSSSSASSISSTKSKASTDKENVGTSNNNRNIQAAESAPSSKSDKKLSTNSNNMMDSTTTNKQSSSMWGKFKQKVSNSTSSSSKEQLLDSSMTLSATSSLSLQ